MVIDRSSSTSIPKPSHQISIESTTIDQTQANRSIISTGYKDTPQHRSIEPQTLELLGFANETQLNLRRRNLVTCAAYCGVAALSILRLRFNINFYIEIESIQELKQPF
jgi:hypothetical protein